MLTHIHVEFVLTTVHTIDLHLKSLLGGFTTFGQFDIIRVGFTLRRFTRARCNFTKPLIVVDFVTLLFYFFLCVLNCSREVLVIDFIVRTTLSCFTQLKKINHYMSLKADIIRAFAPMSTFASFAAFSIC